MNPLRLFPCALTALALGLGFFGLSACGEDAAPAAVQFTPPTPEQAKAAHLLPPDPVLPPGHHRLLETWRDTFGLTMQQELWIEPQLHAEESLTKPILGYKALSTRGRDQILLIIKLAAREQIKVLLTPAQQKLMDQDIESTKEQSARKMARE